MMEAKKNKPTIKKIYDDDTCPISLEEITDLHKAGDAVVFQERVYSRHALIRFFIMQLRRGQTKLTNIFNQEIVDFEADDDLLLSARQLILREEFSRGDIYSYSSFALSFVIGIKIISDVYRCYSKKQDFLIKSIDAIILLAVVLYFFKD